MSPKSLAQMSILVGEGDACLQSVLGKSAKAVPQVEGSGMLFESEMSVGTSLRGKYQTRIPASRSSSAYTFRGNRQNSINIIWDKTILTPPPFLFMASPYVV